MQAVLFSIRPEHCEKIATGDKCIELRKAAPHIPTPFQSFIYCTMGRTLYRSNHDGMIRIYHKQALEAAFAHHTVFNGKVIGEFTCDWIEAYEPCDWGRAATWACVSMDDIHKYMDGHLLVHGLHISELKIYDSPRSLSEFRLWNGCRNCKSEGSYHCVQYCAGRRLERPPQSWCYVEVPE